MEKDFLTIEEYAKKKGVEVTDELIDEWRRKYQPEELTEKMHSELTIDEETDIKHRAGCIWRYGEYPTEEEQKKAAKKYGITWEQALKWKDYWLNLIQKE